MCRKRKAGLSQLVSNMMKEAGDLVGFFRFRTHLPHILCFNRTFFELSDLSVWAMFN